MNIKDIYSTEYQLVFATAVNLLTGWPVTAVIKRVEEKGEPKLQLEMVYFNLGGGKVFTTTGLKDNAPVVDLTDESLYRLVLLKADYIRDIVNIDFDLVLFKKTVYRHAEVLLDSHDILRQHLPHNVISIHSKRA